MPKVDVIFYKENDGTVPMSEWLRNLQSKAQSKCYVKLERLADCGHELLRPEADYLRDGIYELRVKFQKLNLRMLYFFFGGAAVAVSHGFAKEDRVPASEIDKAVERKKKFEDNPEPHISVWERP
jgi:phage-related protein